MIEYGTLSESGGAELVCTSSGGALDGVTTGSNLDLATNSKAHAYIVNGLTLNNTTVYLGNTSGTTSGAARFRRQTLGGAGTVLFGASGGNYINTDGSTLTIGPLITVQGSSGGFNLDYGPLINQGTISADGSGGGTGGRR